MIEQAHVLLARAGSHGVDGPFQLAAAIAAVHSQARTAEATDWRAIALLYERLYQLTPTAVVALNRAVAIGFVCGVEDALRALDECARDGRLDDYHPYYLVRADLAQRAGDLEGALAALQRALELTQNAREQAFLRRRVAEIAAAR